MASRVLAFDADCLLELVVVVVPVLEHPVKLSVMKATIITNAVFFFMCFLSGSRRIAMTH